MTNERAVIALGVLAAAAAAWWWWQQSAAGAAAAPAAGDGAASAGSSGGLNFDPSQVPDGSAISAGSFDLSGLFSLPSGETFASYLGNLADMNAPRGIRNNNPGNIKNDGTAWQGLAASQTDPVFYQFTAASWGIRAIAHIFRSKQARGLVTPNQMISGAGGWAPSTVDNNPESYANAVAQALGVGPDDAVDLSAPAAMQALVTEIIQFENDQQPYAADYIAAAVAMP